MRTSLLVLLAACGGDGIHHLAPDVVLDDVPPPLTNQTHARFTFHAEGDAIELACTVDGTTAPCTSPFEIDLGDGAHRFAVAADGGKPAGFDWTIDTVAPRATITSAPPALDTMPSEQIAFTVDDATATVECALDGAAFAACSSPVTLTPADGDHAFVVHARDAAGNVDAVPPTAAWTLDTSLPHALITAGPTAGSTTGPGVTFSFVGAGGATAFDCALDGGGFAACVSPVALTLADGAHSFVVRGRDEHLAQPDPPSIAWTVDATAPAVAIDAHPADPSNLAAPTFAFSSRDPGASLACSVDDGAFAACASPLALALPDGAHAFTVEATDAVGNASTETFSWTIDTVAPVVTVTAAPPSVTNETTGTIGFAASEGTARCRVDAGPAIACTSPVSFPGLTDGNHTATIEAIDAAGNTGTATASWVVDTIPPAATITGHPANPASSRSATFAFSAAGASSFACKLDAGAPAACTSPATFTLPSDGNHTFAVTATDTAGNASIATFAWTIDTVAPVVAITAHPANPTSATTASLSFTVSDGAVSCQLDAAAPVSCTSPFTHAVAQGNHTFVVRSKDAAGNTGSASFAWTVDTTAPAVTFTTVPADPSATGDATFAWTASEPATFACQLDGGAFAACAPSTSFTGLADGAHTFVVRATDGVGNARAASFAWTVQSPPTVQITSVSDGCTSPITITFTASSGTTECSLDGGPFAPCTSPTTVVVSANFDPFTVQATNAAGTGSATTTLACLPP